MKAAALRHRLLVGWFLGLGTAALVGAIAGGLIISGVAFNTSASSPHTKPFAWAIHVTMINSVRRRAGGEERPEMAKNASLLRGAQAYERDCVACHGGPGVARAKWVSAMLPTPPYLLDAQARWSHDDLYQILEHGIKMSGMPAWGEIETDQTISDLVLLLETMPELTPAQFAALRERAFGRAAQQRPNLRQ